MTILFASDLDQTLIYSHRSMGPDVTPEELQVVEHLEGKPQSFMTRRGQKALWELEKSAVFVPVTTRTQEQYERVTGIYRDGQLPRFAVISNGAVILENGQPVRDWSDNIRKQCIDKKTVIEELMPEIKRHFSEEWVLRIRQADDWFVYLIVDREGFPVENLEYYTKVFREIGWGMSLQGRKLYFMPESITKAAAMEYVRDRMEAELVVAAGDSLLDLDLLESADLGFLAAHGEAVRSRSAISSHIQVTEQTGIKAGEEILAGVADISLQSK
ncbi:hypothetical protein [Planococcus salinus]|uniref:Sucrose phosphatase-like domain-containing protein n=1 Tax=Planococcus salinus TaxID=1848460 RepID=A0A3M8P9B8_9BACL|nr:hypothetical protein [Planococcus salinus]RNF40268.1 hypothetical protein EEX84_06455 [Planococcus salinus]